MMYDEKELTGSELLGVMNAASQKRIAAALNALKAEGLIFYAVAILIAALFARYPQEFEFMRLTGLYVISALGAGYTVRYVRKTWSARTLCFLLTVSLMLLVFRGSIKIFADMVICHFAGPDNPIVFHWYPTSCFLQGAENCIDLLCRLAGKLFGVAAILIVSSFALKAVAADLLWEGESTIKSITFRHEIVSINESLGKNRLLWLDRLCVVLGWIFLLMNLFWTFYIYWRFDFYLKTVCRQGC